MSRYEVLNTLLHCLVFYIGAGIGSFLNVVIYRVPLGISVNQPRRSFCPSCKKQIPMWLNIPLLSWLMLRGKCANCGCRISPRYFFVELLTGILFYAVFLKVVEPFHNPWLYVKVWGPELLCLWFFVSLLVSGTFIDIDHFILPHRITIGGTVVGLLAAWWVPGLVDEVTHSKGLLISACSAALGLGGLWLVVELGKLAFGRKKYVYPEPVTWQVTQPDDEQPPVVTFDKERYEWEDIFMRASDRMLVSCSKLEVNERSFDSPAIAELWWNRLKVKQGSSLEEFPLEGVKKLIARTTKVVIPREAMGFGDVLFLMMIGSFTGWRSVLFTVLAASVIGTVFALLARITGRSEWGAKIPFGPYLALGAVLWLFYGPAFMDWYLDHVVGWGR